MRLDSGVLAGRRSDGAARLAAFSVAPAAGAAAARLWALCGQGSPFDPHQPAHIVGEIGERDLGRRGVYLWRCKTTKQIAYVGKAAGAGGLRHRIFKQHLSPCIARRYLSEFHVRTSS
jgi:hypothetical protein